MLAAEFTGDDAHALGPGLARAGGTGAGPPCPAGGTRAGPGTARRGGAIALGMRLTIGAGAGFAEGLAFRAGRASGTSCLALEGGAFTAFAFGSQAGRAGGTLGGSGIVATGTTWGAGEVTIARGTAALARR